MGGGGGRLGGGWGGGGGECASADAVIGGWSECMCIKPENWGRFLTLCFCCTCCCVAMRDWKDYSPVIRERMHGLEGLRINVTDECNGCGKCVKSCFTSSIAIVDERARIDLNCKGCGICAEVCPSDAINISVSDGDKLLSEAFKRIESCADIVSGSE